MTFHSTSGTSVSVCAGDLMSLRVLDFHVHHGTDVAMKSLEQHLVIDRPLCLPLAPPIELAHVCQLKLIHRTPSELVHDNRLVLPGSRANTHRGVIAAMHVPGQEYQALDAVRWRYGR